MAAKQKDKELEAQNRIGQVLKMKKDKKEEIRKRNWGLIPSPSAKKQEEDYLQEQDDEDADSDAEPQKMEDVLEESIQKVNVEGEPLIRKQDKVKIRRQQRIEAKM